MALTSNDLSALSQLFEETLDKKLDYMLDKKLDEKLDKALDEKFEKMLDEKLDKALLPIKQQLHTIDFRLDTVEKKMVMIDAQQNTIILALDQLNQRLSSVEDKVDGLVIRMDSLESRMDSLEANLHVIKVDLLENTVLPRLNEIEACYLSTYERYKISSDKAETYFNDTDLLKKTVESHSEQLRKLA